MIPWNEYSVTNCVICDIDGTLAIRGDRGPFELHKVDMDRINWYVRHQLQLFTQFDLTTTIFLFSGREEICRSDTEEWLARHEVPYDYLIMRKEKDYRQDTIIKREMYDMYIRDQYFVQAVYDDRPSVIRMWKELGLPVFNVGDSIEF